jgi:two-component sensor histidine kinase
LIVTELVSNSLIHAFPDGRGRVSVAMKHSAGKITLAVSDNGIGISSTRVRDRDSMGLSLVSALTKDDLKGTDKVSGENGTRWVITFPAIIAL